jgi:hypothetical protein
MLLAERVEHFGRLLGEADDAAGAEEPGLGIRDRGFGNAVRHTSLVIPAKAGIHARWIPAFAGMTKGAVSLLQAAG